MRLLVIEDSADDIETVRRLARMSPIAVDVIPYQDGARALDWLATSSETPDLILLDLNLPGLCGADVLRRIKSRSHLRDVPVIVVSGSDNDDDIIEGVHLGAHSHITKPICRGDFAWIVASVRSAQPRLRTLQQIGERGRNSDDARTQPQE